MFTAAIIASIAAFAVTPTPAEMDDMRGFVSRSGQRPFSFTLGDKSSAEILSADKLDGNLNRNEQTYDLVWHAADSSLECRCQVTQFTDFPAVEWVLYLKNVGNADTPIIADIQSLDCDIELPRDKGARIRYSRGSECRLDDFEPMTTSLGPNIDDPQGAWIGKSNPLRLQSKSGRSSCGTLPFFNLDMLDHGVIGAIGWTGDWAASFYRTDSHVHMTAGMQRTHLKLLPGEEIRLPRIMLLFWRGDSTRGQNLLRQFILAHHRPMQKGQPAQAPISFATWGGNFADKHIAHAQWWKENKIPLDYLWVDAGWFGEDEAKEGANVFNSQWGRFVGDWQPNSGYFPNGLKPIGDALHQMDMSFLLWLEPERVFKGTTWTKQHPEWLMGPVGDNYLFNLGIPEARQMLTDFLSNLIAESNLGCYRQDFNMDPRPFWDAADAPDRVGISEIKHITGMYAMWDELLKRHPNLLIDNCSSGGRRIDLETISRSIPLWRSDVQCFPGFGVTAMQGQTHGLGMWVPLSTGCCDREDTYSFRSALGPGFIWIMADYEKDPSKNFSIPWMRQRAAELDAARKYFLGDFYPLVSYSLATDTWAAWQFDRSDLREGLVLAFRRPDSPFAVMTPKLRAIDPAKQYEIRDFDSSDTQKLSGQSLTEAGMQIQIGSTPGSKMYIYKMIN
jgi:alpha-galactosidase